MKEKNINFVLFILGLIGPILSSILFKKIKCTALKKALQYLIPILAAFVLIYIV